MTLKQEAVDLLDRVRQLESETRDTLVSVEDPENPMLYSVIDALIGAAAHVDEAKRRMQGGADE